jgi:hypothetical protein
VKFSKGSSGNPKGRKPGGLNKLTAQIRTMADGAMPKVIEDLIEQTKAGDRESRALFLKVFKPPTPRLVTTPVTIEPAANADQARAQIGQLVSLAAAGQFDIDALRTLVEALRISIDGRVLELEGLVKDLMERHEETANEH